ncbi:MAG: hypothetical protein U9P68_05215 [Pseudomonadota bacterium]|nr:hypothetical protein [Pseudomonadota bacterium]
MKTLNGAALVLALALAGCGAGDENPAAGGAAGDAPRVIDGRWGITAAACSPENGMRDGVVEISGGQIRVGMDTCDIATAEPLEGNAWRLSAQCASGEGGDPYDVRYVAAGTPNGDLRWTDEARDRTETYVNCATAADGG